MLDATSEKRFLLLKKRLDALHYCQPFNIESASLIEKLLNDLIKTTEGFQSIKKINEELKQSVHKSEQMILPLKKENAKLVQENNDLHFEMIKIKEESDYNSSKWQTTFNRLDGERNDLKFLLEQKDSKIRKLEDDNFLVKSKLDVILKKTHFSGKRGLENLPAEVNSLKVNAGTKFEMSKPLRPSDDNQKELEELKNYQSEDFKNWAESLRKADERSNKFKSDLSDAQNEKLNLEQKVKHLEQQITNRNHEISRLQSRLDVTGSNVEKLSTDYHMKAHEDRIEKLNAQIDFLNKENFNLEDDLKKAKRDLHKTDDVRSDNSRLTDTIKDLRAQNERLKESVEQSETILERLRGKRLREDNELIEQKNRETEELRAKVKDLTNILEKAETENMRLKGTSNQANQTLSAYNTDKKAMMEWLEESKQKEERFLSEIQKASDENDLLRKELNNQEDTITVLRSKSTNLQRELDIVNQNLLRDEEEVREKGEVVKKLRTRINDLEQDILNLNAEKSNALNESDRMRKLKEHAEEQLESLRNETYKARANVDTNEFAKQRVQALYDGAVKDTEFLKKDNKLLEDQVQKLKRDLLDYETKCTEYFNNLKIAQEKEKGLQREIELTQEKLANKIEECRKYDNARLESERKCFDLQNQNDKLQEQLAQSRKLREEIGSHESERGRLLRRIDELEIEVKDKTEQINKVMELADKERNDKLKLSERLDRLISDADNIESNIQRARDRDAEFDRLLKDMDILKEKEANLIRENEKYLMENKRQENLIANGTRQVEHINLQKEELAREIRALKEEVSLYKSNDNDIKTKAIKLQEKVNNYDILVADLKDARSTEERKNLRLSEEINALKQDLEQEKAKNQQLNEQIKQLKTLSEGLDRTREELLIRLQSKNNERGLEENERIRMQEEINTLKRRFANVEQDAKEARTAMIQIDRERDNVQNLLDEKSEAYMRLRNQVESQEDELRTIKEKSVEFMAMNDEGNIRVQELESQMREMIKKNRGISEEISEYRNALAVKDVELQNLSSDLNILTKENQNLNARLMHTLDEREGIKDVLNNVSTQEKVSRQSLRAAEMERNDILTNYKSVCMENERLKRSVDELSADNQELFRKVREAESEISFYKAQLQQCEVKETQYLNEISTFERQVTHLNRRLEQAEMAIKDSSDAKDNLMREFQNIRHVSDSLEWNKDELHRRFIAVEQEKAYLNTKIIDIRAQNETLQEQLSYERKQAQRLEELLGEERKIQFKQHSELQKAENEKVELNMEVQRLTRKVSEVQTWQGREADSSDMHSDLRKELNVLRRTMDAKDKDINSLIEENKGLREEKTKARMELMKVESERGEFLEKQKLRENQFGSTFRSDRSFEDSRMEGSGGWSRSRYDRDHFKRSLNEANISSHLLKEKVDHLNQEYLNALPKTHSKY